MWARSDCLSLTSNSMIDERTIESILDRIDIVDVVSRYVPDLKQKGSNYQCCCPFHSERTPSFIVNRARNTWHCFGACAEGGNAIKFVMKYNNYTFPEAVKELAGMCGVTIEENKEKPSSEQIEKNKKREAMLIAYEVLQRFFEAQLRASDEEATRAYSYATKRWNPNFIQESGIGYSPRNSKLLIRYAEANNVSIELLKQMDLLRESERDESLYAFFRERIMIPIRDRFSRVIGYTARYIGSNPDTPKYLNSSTSLLYNKERSVFGIHLATRAAVKENKCFLVEGAPDVLRLQLIGVNNVAASLGSAWTENQLKVLKRLTTRLCFLPDADPPKGGEPFGTGIKAAIKNALLAIETGFEVTVKEIPLTAGGTKNDPDSYCTSKKVLDSINEEDFILWYAKKLFTDSATQDEKSSAVIAIANLIATVNDDVKLSMYVDNLNKLMPSKAMWRNAIKSAKKQQTEKDIKKSNASVDLDLLEKYGFQEQGHRYISVNNDGRTREWSNFVLKPLFHIKDMVNPVRLYKITNVNNQSEIVELRADELVSVSKFKQRIEGLGNYLWFAKDDQLMALKRFLYFSTETAVQITQLGWQRQGFYAFGNGIFDTEWHPVDELGIVRLGEQGNYYLPAFSMVYKDDTQFYQFERNFVHLNYGTISLHDYSKKLINVFGDNAKVGLCFLLASLFKDVIVGYTKNFPILNLFGPKGSGKSELGHSLMSFFIIENTPPNIVNSTLPALADAVAQCANAIVHLDEFKNTIEVDKREFLKGLWDGTGRTRMNMDRDKKREVTKVSCGVIISGQEMASADIALFSRFIFLSYSKSEFSPEARKKFQELTEIRKHGCSHLTLQILKYRAKFIQEFKNSYYFCKEDVSSVLENAGIEDRVLFNWYVVLAAYHALKDVIDMPFDYKEIREIFIKGITTQNHETKSNNELANFWNIVSYLRQEGKIWNGCDYRIDLEDRIKCSNRNNEIVFQQTKRILYLRYSRIFQLYKIHGRQVNEVLIPPASLVYYLENSPAYFGKKRSWRYKIIINGIEQTEERRDPHTGFTKYVKKYGFDQVMCFDYDKLKEAYGINLEDTTSNEYPDL